MALCTRGAQPFALHTVFLLGISLFLSYLPARLAIPLPPPSSLRVGTPTLLPSSLCRLPLKEDVEAVFKACLRPKLYPFCLSGYALVAKEYRHRSKLPIVCSLAYTRSLHPSLFLPLRFLMSCGERNLKSRVNRKETVEWGEWGAEKEGVGERDWTGENERAKERKKTSIFKTPERSGRFGLGSCRYFRVTFVCFGYTFFVLPESVGVFQGLLNPKLEQPTWACFYHGLL